MLRFKSTAFALIAAVITAAAAPSNAAPINYGDFSDIPPGSVMYLDVTESTGTDVEPLFGAPAISGDTLDFDPAGFIAFAGSGGSDLTDGQLNFHMMTAQPGIAISSIQVAESGDYSLLGVGSAATLVSAGVSVHVTVLEVDGVALATPITDAATSSFSTSLGSSSTGLSPWTLGLNYNLNALLATHNVSAIYGVTKAEIVIDNLLAAISEPQTTALIAKKNFMIIPTTNSDPIPEPASLTLLGLGAACLIRRR